MDTFSQCFLFFLLGFNTGGILILLWKTTNVDTQKEISK